MENENKFKLGKKLKLERVKMDLTLKEVAEALDVSPSTVNYLENKQTDLLLTKYLSFFRKKGVDLNKLFNDIDES